MYSKQWPMLRMVIIDEIFYEIAKHTIDLKQTIEP